jgi:ABC-type amino acid transport system permease subunit
MTRSSFKRFLVPLHITGLVYVLTLAVVEPTSRLNLARVLFLLLFRQVPALVQLVGCTIYYGKAAVLGWIPFRYAFIMLKHYYGLEAFLGFNARPVVTERVRESLRPAPRRRAMAEVTVAES